MFEAGLVAFTTLFATVSPVDAAAIYAAIAAPATPLRRRQMAIKGTLIAAGVLYVFAFFGNDVLQYMGITLPALRTAGGALLFLIAMDMVFARHSGGSSTTADENREATGKEDISVFPLATPLIAGPGALGATIILMGNAHGSPEKAAAVLIALALVLAITLALLLLAGQVQKLLGVTGLNVITRVVGILLAALAVQFIFDGIKASGLLG